MSQISIICDDDNRIVTKFNGSKDGDKWIQVSDDIWPDAEPADNERPHFYFDPKTGDITVEYETVERPDEQE